jgi:DNA-binding MarR family transcriptional regulator
MTLRIVPRVLRAAHRIGVFMKHGGEKGVTLAEAFVLSHLASHGDSTIAQLHTAFGHKRSTLTSILDRLETRGFVSRQLTKDDRRTYTIQLCAGGEKAGAEINKRLAGFEKRILAAAGSQQVRGFEAVIDAVDQIT